MKKKDIKKFFKEHKTEIIIGAIAAVGVVCAVISAHDDTAEHEPVKIPDEMPYPKHDYIDEDIFTDLAPQIEDLVLTEGSDEGYIEKTYHVEWPVCRIDELGNCHEGTREEVKKVTVNIVDITEP